MSEPFIDDPDFRLFVGDVREQLAHLDEGSIDCCVTSPPYFGLRDYGTGTWDGGETGCDHVEAISHRDQERPVQDGTFRYTSVPLEIHYRGTCAKCGATRVDHQIGLEQTPNDYVSQIVAVFREVRRVLADHGTCWLNLGDSYNSGGGGPQGETGDRADRTFTANSKAWRNGSGRADGVVDERGQRNRDGISAPGLKPKDLIGIPHRVVHALQADGWYLRSTIIWAKPNPMPESVTDRPTTSHEYVFLLAKSERYYYDQEAVREPMVYGDHSRNADSRYQAPGQAEHTGIRQAGLQLPPLAVHPDQETLDPSLPHEAPRGPDGRRKTTVEGRDGSLQHRSGERWPEMRPQLKRALELFEQHGLTDDHLEAIRACGSSDAGKAQVTQTGYGRNTAEMQALADEAKAVLGGYYREFLTPIGGRNARTVWTIAEETDDAAAWLAQVFLEAMRAGREDVAGTVWQIATQPFKGAHFATYPQELVRRCIAAGCPEQVCETCGKPRERIVKRTPMEVRESDRLAERREADTVNDARTVGWTDCGHDAWRPGRVLDPFMGSGTTAIVARAHRRHAVGVELNPEYAELCRVRTGQLSLLT